MKECMCEREENVCVGGKEKENEREKQQVRMGLGTWIEESTVDFRERKK